MSNKSSAGAFCSLVVATTTGTSDSVTSLDVAARGNGAECFCIANQSVYRYNSASTQTTLGDTFIQPTTGGGCWVKQNAFSDYTQQVTGTSTFHGLAQGALTINTWRSYPTSAGAYAASFTGTIWSVNTTTGVVTYNGPAGLKFAFQACVAFNDDSGAAEQLFEVSLSKNGALQATTTNDPSAQSGTLVGTAGFDTEFAHNFIVTPVPTDTFQYVMRCLSAAPGAVVMSRFQQLISQV